MSHFNLDWLGIYAHGWQPCRPPAAVVCLVHGLGEHSSRYAHVAAAFNRAGLSLLTFDLPGHGRSPGKRGDFAGFETLLEQVDTLLGKAGQHYPQLPRFLYGHSMGGNLVLNYVLRRRPTLAGVIVTAPWLGLTSPPSRFLTRAVRGLNRLWPSLTLASGLNPEYISRRPEMVRAYKSDPLIHNRVSVRLFCSLSDSAAWILAQAAAFPLPLLLIHGSADRLTNPQASRQFAAAVPGDCTFKLWPGLYHEIHQEPEQDQVIELIVQWMQARV